MLTGITVVYNTKGLIDRVIKSVRKFYPELPLIIVNGSTPGHKCDIYLKSNPYDNCTIYHIGSNIGHGRGLNYGFSKCKTKQALLFDSDIEMKKGGIIEKMQANLKDSSYGIGEICYTDKNGRNVTIGIPYLHPYFMLINKIQYLKYKKFIKHGAPCIKTMLDLYEQSKSSMLIEFPVKDFIKHDYRGTRNLNPPEFLKNWEKL
ncbi:hypothetical protein LCGC14_0716430 [marine sediment metagenome]|uniref:Glycosyltransferase 2-like domain-containing protein n=1 Tax=marine sediment metagenome TaxID=412755 RepID=A0A0F9QI20_9ZZZZ